MLPHGVQHPDAGTSSERPRQTTTSFGGASFLKAGAASMTERLTDPRTIQQQQQAERNRSAMQRGLQHARHEAHRETLELGRKLPDRPAKSIPAKTS
jgi:hypothetical protein